MAYSCTRVLTKCSQIFGAICSSGLCILHGSFLLHLGLGEGGGGIVYSLGVAIGAVLT